LERLELPVEPALQPVPAVAHSLDLLHSDVACSSEHDAAFAVSGSLKTKAWPCVAACDGDPLGLVRVDNKLAEIHGLVDAPEDGLVGVLEDAPEDGAQDGTVDDHLARAVLVARNTLFSVSSN